MPQLNEDVVGSALKNEASESRQWTDDNGPCTGKLSSRIWKQKLILWPYAAGFIVIRDMRYQIGKPPHSRYNSRMLHSRSCRDDSLPATTIAAPVNTAPVNTKGISTINEDSHPQHVHISTSGRCCSRVGINIRFNGGWCHAVLLGSDVALGWWFWLACLSSM